MVLLAMHIIRRETIEGFYTARERAMINLDRIIRARDRLRELRRRRRAKQTAAASGGSRLS
jgi:hypothetical protein